MIAIKTAGFDPLRHNRGPLLISARMPSCRSSANEPSCAAVAGWPARARVDSASARRMRCWLALRGSPPGRRDRPVCGTLVSVQDVDVRATFSADLDNLANEPGCRAAPYRLHLFP